MRHRPIAQIVVAVLLAASPAAAHRSSSPQCFQDPPARNSEGPPEEDGYWEEIVDIGMQGIHAIHLPTGKLLFWAYNVGSGVQTTLAEAVEVARRVLGIAAAHEWGSMPARTWDTAVWVADPRRIQAALGWRPQADFAGGFARFVEWFRERPAIQALYRRRRSSPPG